MKAEEILERMQVTGNAHTYALGCRESRVTIYAQQVRALNLVWALTELHQIDSDTRVVIVGAGAAGLTAALGFGCKGAGVYIVERNEVILPRFRGNTQRYLHPHAYDWPNSGATELAAGLPLMNWTAGLASGVTAQLARAWTVERTRCDSIQLYLGTTAKKIDVDRKVVICDGAAPLSLAYDILVFAVGVGTEHSQFGTPTYWDNDSLAQLYNSAPTSVLVSGNGDGALVDVIRAALIDFDHARLMTQVLSSPAAYALQEQVSQIEKHASSDNAFNLDDAYAGLDLSEVLQFVRGRIRTQRKVILNVAEEHLFRRDTMALNRVLVECLRRSGLELWPGRVKSAVRNDRGIVVTLSEGAERLFDLAVFRHGPANDLKAEFPAFREGNHNRKSDDPARVPHWPENYFAAPQSRKSLEIEPNGYDVVELDEGFGLTSRAWSMNELGAVVGWTELPRSTDHAAFVWSGSGLPPELFSVPGVEKTAATDINVHGDYLVSTGGGGSQAWLVSRGQLTVLNGVGPRAMPYSINDTGQVVGWCDADGQCQPCIWHDGHPELLENRGYGGVALQINNAGTIVGEIRIVPNGASAAARWCNGRLELFCPPQPYTSARAFRVNNDGLVVGYLMKAGFSDFFIWPPDAQPAIIDQGEAYGVNDSGWIAGRAGVQGAFLYNNGKMFWLDQMVNDGWQIVWPFCLINDLRMVGVGRRFGVERAILLVPRRTTHPNPR
ncbi:MAG: hypothetical protein QOH70_2366 [Blastocatellia bacterium]|jgi:uncharacterized membrane protein|nr:hypothetical protein [Blastocatellia bacterium]